MFVAFVSTLCGSLLSICITCLAAFAVTLIFKTSTTTNFAQGSFAALGCYVTADLFNKYGVPVWLGLFGGMVVGIISGLSWIVRMLILFVVGRLKLLRGRGKVIHAKCK